MRFKSLCSLGLMTAIGGPLCAGWKITTLTTTAEGRRTTGTEYFQGDLRRTESQPGKDGASELRIDGWYVDADSLPRYKRSGGISFFQPRGVPVPVIKVNRQGPAETGLAIWEKWASASTAPTGEKNIAAESTMEVTELFEGELDKAVFEPPPGFQRVLHLSGDYAPPWDEQFRLRWEWFQDWLRNLAE